MFKTVVVAVAFPYNKISWFLYYIQYVKETWDKEGIFIVGLNPNDYKADYMIDW